MPSLHLAKHDARALIVELELPQVVLDIFDGRPPALLDVHFACPEEYYWMPAEEQAIYAPERVVPLLDGGSFDIVYGYDLQDRAFLRFFVEDPGSVLSAPRWSWQQLVGHKLQALWESEMTDDELRQVSTMLGFRHLDLMLKRLEGAALSTFESHGKWLDSFLAEVGRLDARQG